MMSGRMHRAIASIACCGIPELFTGFFLRTKFSNFPPVQYEIFKVRLVCAYKRGRWQTSFLMWDYSIPGWIYDVPPSKKLKNENADTCQAIAFLCLHIFILLCANIIPKATNTVKRITSYKYRDQKTGKPSRLLRKKRLRCNSFFFKTRSPGIVYRFSG